MPTSILQSSDPFSEWLGSNQPVPESHVETLGSFLKSQHSELSSFDREIHNLQCALEARRAQQTKLRTGVEAHQRLLSPIRRLPIEIMQHIFLFCRNAHRIPLLRPEEAPLLLTRVCRDWRDLAYATPTLWDRVHIPIPETFEHKATKFPMACVERWLDAAKHAPLSISIWSDCARTEGSEGSPELFFRKVLLDRAPRIRYLELDIGRGLLNFIAATLPSESWAMLEKLKLKRTYDGDGTLGAISELPIWNAPNLRRIEFEAVRADIFDLPVDWGKVEEIRVDGDTLGGEWEPEWDEFSASEAHALIRDSPNLQDLNISLNDDGTEFFLPVQSNASPINWEAPLVLGHLTRLDLTDKYVDPALNPIAFLRGLQLPALETLSYCLVTRREFHTAESSLAPLPHGDAHPLIAFLKAQAQPIRIKHFRLLNASTMSQVDFTECVKMMPLLERLWVEDRRLNYQSGDVKADPEEEVAPSATLLRMLQPPGGDPLQVLCPRLRTLKLDRVEETSLEDAEEFIMNRLDMADRYPTLSSFDSRERPTQFPGVARLQRMYLGLLLYKPDHVPKRDYGEDPGNSGFIASAKRRAPTCALEEDLWEQGVNARIQLWERSWEMMELKFAKEKYEPYGGLPLGSNHGWYHEGWP